VSRLSIKKIADLGDESFELFWHAGLLEVNSDWFVRSVMLGLDSGRFNMIELPIGLLPVLSLGHVFDKGEMLDRTVRGIHGSALILNMSNFEDITSDQIPRKLYSFSKSSGGTQHVIRFRSTKGVVLIPAIELIRYLFLHNCTLANSLMRPGGLNLLFHPEMPGFQRKLNLRFTALMPSNCLSSQFAQEFAWIALDSGARKSWDSVYLQSRDQKYVTFIPPPIHESTWKFRGIQDGDQWFVLELLHLTGKVHPCNELIYGHPSMKEIIYGDGGDYSMPNSDFSDDGNFTEHVIHDYELDDGQDGAKAGSLKTTEAYSKQSSFDTDITVKKMVIKIDGQPGNAKRKQSTATGTKVEVHKIIKVSAGDRNLFATLQPLEFKLLTPAASDCIGDLDALSETVKEMARRLPEVHFAMSLCQLKPGRVFSKANRKPRVGLVVIVTATGNPSIVLLDVERSGDVALSLVALHFHRQVSFDLIESSVKKALDGLVDASGHWDHDVELELSDVCKCERLPKILTPRKKAKVKGQTTLWAIKLLHKLGLEEYPRERS